MTRLLLALGLLADGACLALLIGVAGFVFEGPEGARGEPSAVAIWSGGAVLTTVAAAGALVLARRSQLGQGAAVAWIPPLFGLVLALGLGEVVLPP
jgi:hypothetical protein